MKAAIVNNIILDDTTYLAIKKEYNRLWTLPQLQQIINNTVTTIIAKAISFGYIEKYEVENMLYIRFVEYTDKYTPVYEGDKLIPFRAYIITKLKTLQQFPTGLAHGFIDIGRKYQMIPASCYKPSTQLDGDFDSLANLSGESDSYTLEDNKKVIINLINQTGSFFTKKEKEVIINYVTHDIETQTNYYAKFGKSSVAQIFKNVRKKLKNNPKALDDLLDYLYNYDYNQKQKLINRIVNGEKLRAEKTRQTTRKPRKKVLCIAPDGVETIYRSVALVAKELNIEYYQVRKCALGVTDSVEGYKIKLID